MIDRRKFMKIAGTASFAAGSLSVTSMARAAMSSSFIPDVEFGLEAVVDEVPILQGSPTNVWRFRGKVIKGDASNLVTLNDTYTGPIFKVRQGQNIRVRFVNRLPAETVVHWHGLVVPELADGHPMHAIPFGREYIYDFTAINRAGMYWFHPHPHMRTGFQVYGGLAGLFIITDDEEEAAGLPSGEFEIPMVIQDRTFDPANQLVYLASPMQMMTGFLGDRIVVNGRPEFVLPVATRSYRLRLLNGSNSRIYRLAWSDGRPLTILGTDGGLLDRPVSLPEVMFAPAERLDLWVDFSRDPVDSGVSLISLPFDGGVSSRGGMGMMGGATGLPNGAPLTVFRVHVNLGMTESSPLPDRLARLDRFDPRQAVNGGLPRPFIISMGHMKWLINGREFEMTNVAPDEVFRLGDLEIVEFFNAGGMGMGGMGRRGGMGGGMMGMMNLPHPIHIHTTQFQVLERVGGWMGPFMDYGFKDTVLVMPGQRVRLMVKFETYPGLFMYHCHNLEHEDMGMMRNILLT